MICFIEAGRIDDVRRLYRIDEVENGYACGLHARHVRHDVVLGNFSALHCDCAYTGDTVQWRLQLISGYLPKLRLRQTVGGEAVSEDWKGCERKTVGRNYGRAGECLSYFAERCIDELKRAEHVDVPVEEETDFSGAAAGVRTHGEQAGDRIDGILDWLCDGYLHLFDGHNTVVDADDDAREVCFGKD